MLELTTFGGLGLASDHHPVDRAIAQRRRLLVLAVLASDYPAALARETLGVLLWSDAEPDAARNNLRQAIFALRHGARALGVDADPVIGTAELALNSTIVAADCVAFRAAIETGDHAAAIRLYHGGFLAGVEIPDSPAFSEWVRPRRELYAAQLRSACVALATAAASRGDWNAALESWHTLRLHSPSDRDAVRGVLTALVAMGRTTEAELFAQTHGVTLPAATTELLSPQRPWPGAASAVASARAPSRTLLRRRVQIAALAGGAGLVALAAFAANHAARRDSRGAPSSEPTADSSESASEIALFPLTGPAGDTTMSAVGALAQEAAVAQLESFGGVRVVPTEHATPTPFVFRGSYRFVGDRVRLDAAVEHRTSSGTKVVSLRPVVVPRNQIVGGTGALAREAAAAVAFLVDSLWLPSAPATAPPPSYSAFADFIAGENAADGHEDFRSALGYFRRAMGPDTSYAMAAILAARMYREMGDCDSSRALLVNLRKHELRSFDRAYADMTTAACDADWFTYYNAARRMIRAAPGSQFALAAGVFAAVRANQLAAADSLVRHGPLRPSLMDCGFVSFLYHALGQYAREVEYLEAVRRQVDANQDQSRGEPGASPTASLRLDLASAYAGAGRTDSALALARSVQDVPQLVTYPAGEGMRIVGVELLAHKQPAAATGLLADAIAWYRRQPAASQSTPRMQLLFARALVDGGRASDLAEALRMYRALAPATLTLLQEEEIHGRLGLLDTRMGDTRAAEHEIAWLRTQPSAGYYGNPTMWRARIAAEERDTAQALALLGDAISAGYPRWDPPISLESIHQMPELFGLRGTERYKALFRAQ